ncbi:MAG: hypothetical protein ACRC6V_19720 [Bacteroidales bacterium]
MRSVITLIFAYLVICNLLIGCKEDIDGKSKDPELNYSSYVFDNSGESISIYSTLGYQITPFFQPVEGQSDKEPIIYKNYLHVVTEVKGDWYYIELDEKTKGYIVTVDENKTGNQRILPIVFAYQNWASGTKYLQK